MRHVGGFVWSNISVWTLNSLIGTVTTLWVKRDRDGHTAGEKGFCLLQIPQTGCRVHTASYSIGTGDASRRLTGRDFLSTTHLHLGSRLGMSGAILLCPLYAFVKWTGEFLAFTRVFTVSCCLCYEMGFHCSLLFFLNTHV